MIVALMVVTCALLLLVLSFLALIAQYLKQIAQSCERIDAWTCDMLRKVDPDNPYVSGRE